MNTHKKRIVTVSLLLKRLSLFALICTGFFTISTLFLPVVFVGSYYTPPQKTASILNTEPIVQPTTDLVEFSETRMIVELAGTQPSIGYFDYMPGPSLILSERLWSARMFGMIAMAYMLLGTYLFYRLFDVYQTGRVFDLGSIRWLRRIGLWLMGTYVNLLVFNFSKYYWSTTSSIQFSPTSSLFLGAFILLIAWIMEEAHYMEKDLQLTV
ncbi:MAG TPA: DUF2975 domain-containing protein [Verrucomicrobiales bacterium]|nr:DUF2975 domain-containing protein [Verrucomicrobiales bacterium]